MDKGEKTHNRDNNPITETDRGRLQWLGQDGHKGWNTKELELQTGAKKTGSWQLNYKNHKLLCLIIDIGYFN